ncbi:MULTISPECIES: hypothetical protein [Yersinia]|uniref:Uncharacterized protein n=1 Tax=Yersinia enterocolitica LC20 TaxID=1443113 RepID=A0A7U5PGT1_YEREN|nr:MULTISPECIES: hypothetical protein [Yersinia]ATX62907.1 hypothetical protein LC20_08110 [Yersinia hibernica]
MSTATIYTDQHNGKQYRVMNGYSARVQQYPAGVMIYFDGSSHAKPQETNFKTRANLNSWLRMMGFKK